MAKPHTLSKDKGSTLSFRLGDQDDFAFSEELQKAVFAVLPSKDPLDDPAFNAIDFINELFPDEKSLETIDIEISKMKRKIHKIDEEIIESVSKQSRAGAKGKHQLEESRKAIHELFAKIQDIKTKADNSEKMVNDICSDIRDLDFAKRNLSATTRALSNLQTIVQEMEHLKTMAEKRRYSEVANLLEAVKEILRLFADWKEIDRVKELQAAFDSIKRGIKTQVFNEFEHIDANKMPVDQLRNLSDACFVIDAMGKDTLKEFIAHWSNRQLGVYDLQFKPGSEASQLSAVDQRYQWFLKWLRHYQEHQSKVFPPHWRVSEHVAQDFCIRTTDKMMDMLEKTKSTLKVNALKTALKNTLKFETELAKYFGALVMEIPAEDLFKELQPDYNEATNDINQTSVSDELADKIIKAPNIPQEELAAQVMQKFKGIISICFEQYMYLYVENQQQVVQNKINVLMGDETWKIEEGSASKVLSSARGMIDIFSKARQSVATLNQSQAFFDIFGIFKNQLSLYADRLQQRLAQVDLVAAKQRSNDDEVLCCILINTGEYCATMALTIQNVIKSEISPKFKDQVVLDAEHDKFVQVIAHARESLSKLIAIALEPAFIEMNKTNWEKFTADGSVLDASPYVGIAANYIRERVPVFRKNIMSSDAFKSEVFESTPSPNYFQIICDTILAYFTRRYDAALRACRRIGEAGAQQLVTDLAQFKKLLETLPILQAEITDKEKAAGEDYVKSRESQPLVAPAAYIKKVKREVETLEKTLKVIWTPQDMLVDTYKALLPNHADTDFVSIMQLKGIPYAEQHLLLDAFGSPKDSPARDLVSRDWVISSKSAIDTTSQTVKNALLSLNVFAKD